MKMKLLATVAFMIAALPLAAEEATYGEVYLSGLSRDGSWILNDFSEHNVMVCNVNGPDGFLSVRAGPGSNFDQVRAFNRLAVLLVDASERQGHWVKVYGAFRSHTKEGQRQDHKQLRVVGWAHDGYMCDFID